MISSISPAIGRAASRANLFILAAIIGLNVAEDDDEEEVEDDELVAVFDARPGILCVTSGDINIPNKRPTHSSFHVASMGRIFSRNVLLPLRLSMEIRSFGSALLLTFLSLWWTDVGSYDENAEDDTGDDKEELTGKNCEDELEE